VFAWFDHLRRGENNLPCAVPTASSAKSAS
jgi:hypothetical protein